MSRSDYFAIFALTNWAMAVVDLADRAHWVLTLVTAALGCFCAVLARVQWSEA